MSKWNDRRTEEGEDKKEEEEEKESIYKWSIITFKLSPSNF